MITLNDAGARDGTEFLFAVARCIVELAEQDRTVSFTLPYPRAVQLALDRVVLHCLHSDEEPPASVPDLIAWCRKRTVEEWPFTVPPGLVSSGARLVDRVTGRPTRICLELASAGPLGTLGQEARSLLDGVADACSSAVLFASCRDFLLNHVVVSPQTLRKVQGSASIQVWNRVRHLYRPLADVYTSRHVDRRVFAQCTECGHPAVPLNAEEFACENEDCRFLCDPPEPQDADGVLVLRTPLRVFLAVPGRTERMVRQRLEEVGCFTEFVPLGLGAHRFTDLCGRTGLLRVFDRVEPALLAAELMQSPVPGEERDLVVVPSRLLRRRPDYLAVLSEDVPARISFLTEQELDSVLGAGSRGRSGEDDA